MNAPVYIFDPTATDTKSRVRGVGRYLKTLHEASDVSFHFTANIGTIPRHALFLNPFFNPNTPPLIMRTIAEKHVAVIHDLIPLKYKAHFPTGLRGQLNTFLNSLSLKLYDRIITDSQASKNDINHILGVSNDKIAVVYPTIQSDFFKDTQTHLSLPHNLSDQSYFIYVGDATWNKNLLNIARAVQKADVTCVCVGQVFQQPPHTNPWTSELRKFLEITSQDKRFIFPGFITDDLLKRLYHGAIANILVSRDEGFGLSYVEAGACRTPTIAGNTPIQQEISTDAALFADPESVESIAGQLTSIKTNKHIRDALAEKAYNRAQYFNPESFKTSLLKALTF